AVPGEASTSCSGRAGSPGTLRTATSFRESKAVTVAGSGLREPATSTAVSCSPATTCAAVTTVSGRATQPEPSTERPHAVPTTRTTLGAACRTPGRPSTDGSGAGTIATGPTTAGNGSTR